VLTAVAAAARLVLADDTVLSISGRIAPVEANAMTVNTPVASFTIRGDAALALSLPPDGPATLALINSGAEASVDITASNGSATLDQSRETVEVIDGGIPGGIFILSDDQAASLFGGVISEFSHGLPLVASIQDDAAPFVFQNFGVVDPTWSSLEGQLFGGGKPLFSPTPPNGPPVSLAAGLANDVSAVPPALALPVFSISDVAASEGARVVTFTVSRSGNLSVSSLVTVSTSSGTATAGIDFVQDSTMVLFDPGISAQTYDVVLTDDSLTEGTESFTASLEVVINGTVPDGAACAGRWRLALRPTKFDR